MGAILALATVGCGARSGLEIPRAAEEVIDAGNDAGFDAGRDAGSDAGRDAGRDAGFDAGEDAGNDAGFDAGFDASFDAGEDASFDAGEDAGFDAGEDAGFDAGEDASFDAGFDAGLIDAGHMHGPLTRRTMALGNEHTCVLRDGVITCWGTNRAGELGDGTFDARTTPGANVALMDVTALFSSWGFTVRTGTFGSHTCAWTSMGATFCWGPNALLEGNTVTGASAHPTPELISSFPNTIAVSGTCYFDAALSSDGTVTTRSAGVAMPTSVTGLTDAIDLGVGSDTACVLLDDGTVWCWGNNGMGYLGDGSVGPRATPGPIPSLSEVVQLSGAGFGACALRANGTVACWGWNAFGQLGDGTTTTRNVPVDVMGLDDVVQVSTGSRHACAIHEDRTVSCWGSNQYGQLGIGSEGGSFPTPMRVPGLEHVVEIVAGPLWHTCARTDDDSIWCWGENASNELGDGTTINRPSPIRVF